MSEPRTTSAKYMCPHYPVSAPSIQAVCLTCNPAPVRHVRWVLRQGYARGHGAYYYASEEGLGLWSRDRFDATRFVTKERTIQKMGAIISRERCRVVQLSIYIHTRRSAA